MREKNKEKRNKQKERKKKKKRREGEKEEKGRKEMREGEKAERIKGKKQRNQVHLGGRELFSMTERISAENTALASLSSPVSPFSTLLSNTKTVLAAMRSCAISTWEN